MAPASLQSASAVSVALGVLFVVVGVAALVAAVLVGQRVRSQRCVARQDSEPLHEYADGSELTPPAALTPHRSDSFARTDNGTRLSQRLSRQRPRLQPSSPRGFLGPLLRVLSGVRRESDPVPKASIAHDSSANKSMERSSRAVVALAKFRLADDCVQLGELVFQGACFCYLATVHGADNSERRALASRLGPGVATRDPHQVHVFMDEIVRSASLSHPKIASFLGFCQVGGAPCALTEQPPNGDLESFLAVRPLERHEFQWLSRSKWPTSKAEIALDIVDALVHLHSLAAAIYVRDLRARQVWLADDFSAKLVCFGNDPRFASPQQRMRERIESFGGIASSPTMAASTSLGSASGVCNPREKSVAWMAPELLQGQQDADEHTVVYALGVLLTELDTCELPYTLGMDDMDREHVATLVTSGCIRPSLAPDCPVPIRELILQCLSFAPTDRPSPRAVQSALQRAVVRSRLHAASATAANVPKEA